MCRGRWKLHVTWCRDTATGGRRCAAVLSELCQIVKTVKLAVASGGCCGTVSAGVCEAAGGGCTRHGAGLRRQVGGMCCVLRSVSQGRPANWLLLAEVLCLRWLWLHCVCGVCGEAGGGCARRSAGIWRQVDANVETSCTAGCCLCTELSYSEAGNLAVASSGCLPQVVLVA
jgi:hypothetical protein